MLQLINVLTMRTLYMMIYKRAFSIAAIGIAALGTISFAVYDDALDKIKQQLDKWAVEHPVEKVYLHMDKPYYAAGDDIWFKAYVTNGNRLAADSGVLNVELINEQDTIKQHIKLAIKNGVAGGDLALPDTLQQGNYRVRAYTSYMRNAGSEYFFDRAISIINNTIGGSGSNLPDKKAAAKNISINISSAGKPGIQFFPEGGELVNGVPTRVAFKALNSDGLGIGVKGIISDSKGRQIAQFNSTHLGMGAFTFTPVANTLYTAKLIFPDGTEVMAPLPRASERGYVLNITDNGPQGLSVRFLAGPLTLQQDANKEVILIGQSGGKIYYTGKSKPGSVMIAKNIFPAGIIQFTLFSLAGEPLNERLVFNYPDQLRLVLSTEQQTYLARQKIKINVGTTNGRPVQGNFSVSVTDETKVPVNEANENNIWASLLLNADLKGYIEQPSYYFNPAGPEARAGMDLLMLTQGYHRFEWKEVLSNRFVKNAYRPENSLQISGEVTTPSGKPVVNGKIKLINLDDTNFSLDTVTNARGRFVFDDLVFEDSLRFIVQARTSNNKKDVIIHLDSVAPANTSAYKNQLDLKANMSDTLRVYKQSSKALYAAQLRYGVGNHVIPLREVIIREKKQALQYSSNLNGPGNADQVLLARDLRLLGCIYITDCLQGRLLGVIFRNGIPYSTRSNRPMQVIIDGVYVESSYLNTFNYNDIQAIEVLRNAGNTAIYGGRAGNGVLIVTTKRGGEDAYTGPVTGRGIKASYPKGFLKARTFYSPQYTKTGVNKQLADLRTTIYWKPDVLMNNGKASFEYFNASEGNYRVVVEGIDTEGNIGRQVLRYRVDKPDR